MPTNHLVPTSSPPRPARGDDLRNRPRPASPSPSGDEVELASFRRPPQHPHHLVPGTRSNTTRSNAHRAAFNPMHDGPAVATSWTSYDGRVVA
jgi:hypothetical protein